VWLLVQKTGKWDGHELQYLKQLMKTAPVRARAVNMLPQNYLLEVLACSMPICHDMLLFLSALSGRSVRLAPGSCGAFDLTLHQHHCLKCSPLHTQLNWC